MFSAEALLNPVSALQPAGADLSFSSELDAIAQARKFDDPSLDQGEWVTELKEADWDFVQSRCAALLAEQSKDLRLAVWLTEAAATQQHLRGLAEGYRLLAGLCDRFWDLGLHPQAEHGDNDQRIGNLSWILARTPALVRAMPLTEGRPGYSTIDFESARKRASGSGHGAAADAPKLADMETARRNNSAQFSASFAADAQACIDALRQLESVADARLGADSPGFAAARDALETMRHALPTRPAAAPVTAGESTQDIHQGVAEHEVAATPARRAAGPSGAIETRAQAIAQLRAVAQFFRLTEPHSPVSYFAEKAASAGEQDLHTWLRSVIKDEASLSHIEELLGVQPPA